MRAEKGNKVYEIGEADMKRYQSEGFDIYEGEKKIASGRGQTVPIKEYEKLEAENADLKEKMKNMGNESDNEDVIAILTTYAGEHDIDIGRASTVSGIVKKIKEQGAVKKSQEETPQEETPPEGSE